MPEQNHQPTRLRDLLPGATYLPTDSDPAFTVVRTDAAAVLPGDLYVHLDEFDSHGAEVAAARGAEAVVAERRLPDVAAPLVLVDDCHDAHKTLTASTGAVRPAGPALIAVGGVSGSSRTATLLAAIHADAGERVGLLTQTCDDDGEHCLPRRANAQHVASRWLRRCDLGGVTTAITQASTDQPVAAPPLVACLTTLRCDGLDDAGWPRWESIEEHRRAVCRSLGDLDGGVLLVVNADDPDCVRFASNHPGRVYTFGESATADVRAVPVESNTGGQTFIVSVAGDSACVATPTPGRAARRDALAAIATAIAVGFDLPTALRGIDLSPSTSGALETLSCGQPFAVFLDSAVRPTDLADACEGARSDAGRLMATVRLADDPATARRQLAAASRMADRVLAHGEVETLEQELGETPDNVTLVEDRLAAMAVVLGLADPGDSVLLAGVDGDAEGDRDWAAKLLRRRLDCEDRRAAA